MFGNSRREKVPLEDSKLYAPMDGEVFELTKVSENIFAQKLMGEGYAIEPTATSTTAKIYSPVSGRVTISQGHAVGLRRTDGLDIFLHIGIDTVSLNGEPFDINLKIGDFVKGGEKIGSVKWSEIQKANLPLTTTVLITNTAKALEDLNMNYGFASGAEVVGEAKAKQL
ncbi:glucose PTS transporter subunit IIA [Lactococcus muris]|uniref:Glucose PTS transporter subunit IIA n=1 Tax=Lactococcus muris TaxID=2941330 RepID=A0ABV4D6R7_9LACT|nr:PTS glucose transporter subunit IIA [Lactococcus garvieae]